MLVSNIKKLNIKASGIIAFLSVVLTVVLISSLYAQPNVVMVGDKPTSKEKIIRQIQELKNTPTTLENLQQRSKEIKQLLRLLEQKEGKDIVKRIVSPQMKLKFEKAMHFGDYNTACRIADEIISNLVKFFRTARSETKQDRVKGLSEDYFDSPFGYHTAYWDVTPWRNASSAGVRWDRGAGIGAYITPAPRDLMEKLEKGLINEEEVKKETQRRIKNKIYDFSYYDSRISIVPEGINIIQNIQPVKKETEPWVKFFNKPNSWLPKDDYMDYYLWFVEKTVERYDGDGIDDMPNLTTPIKYWQISNEPHYEENMEDLAELVKITQAVIKRADPEAKVILGGASLQPLIEDYLKQLRDYYYPILNELGGQYIDVFDFHWYGKADGDYKKIKIIYQDIRKNLDLRGYKDTEIWVTEMGTYSGDPKGRRYDWPFQTEREQAIDLLKRYVYSLSLGIKKVFWAWGMMEGFPPPDDNSFFDHTGLIYDGEKLSPQDIDKGRGVKKLAFYTYKMMTEQLKGSDWNKIEIIQESDNVYIYKFVVLNKSVYVAWWDYFDDSGDSKTITLNADFAGQVLVTEAAPDAESGAELNENDYPTFFKAKTVSNGKFTITLKESPVFFSL